MKVRVIALVACLLLVPVAPIAAGAQEPDASGPHDSEAVAAQAFERLKSLAGRWQADSTKGWSVEVVWEVISNGSVVMATSHFEEGRKMVTMYSLDQGHLVATHYCEAGNQPFLRATAIADEGRRLLFTYDGGRNLVSRDQGHMDKAALRLIDDGHFTSRWTWYQNGSEQWLEDIEYRRLDATS